MTLVVIGCDRVDRRKSGGNGSQATAERGYRTRLGKLEVKWLVITEMGSCMGDKVEGTVTVHVVNSHLLHISPFYLLRGQEATYQVPCMTLCFTPMSSSVHMSLFVPQFMYTRSHFLVYIPASQALGKSS